MLRGEPEAGIHCDTCSCVGAVRGRRLWGPPPSLRLWRCRRLTFHQAPELSSSVPYPLSPVVYPISAFYKSFRIFLWSELAFELFRREQLPSGTELSCASVTTVSPTLFMAPYKPLQLLGNISRLPTLLPALPLHDLCSTFCPQFTDPACLM